MGGTSVDHERGQQAEGLSAGFAHLQDHARGGAAIARGQRQDAGMGGEGQGGGKQIDPKDHRQPATGGQAAQGRGNPCGDGCDNLQGCGAPGIRGRRAALRIVRRIGDDMVKINAQITGDRGNIAGDHLHHDTVAGGVAAGKVGVIFLHLQPGMNQSGQAGGKTQRSGPRAAAKIKHALACTGIHTGGKQDGIGGRAVPPARLPQLQPAAEKGIVGQIGIGKHLDPRINVIVREHGTGHEMILIPHHQTARQNAKGAVKDAHVDVKFEHRYILALQQGFGKGDHGGVGCAQKLFHPARLCGTDG